MVRIITDSTSDITQEEGVLLGITIVPLTVHFGSASYIDGIDISKKEFYEKLAVAESLPTTSQIPPGEFTPLFQRFIDQGDEVIGIFISSELSGTYQSAAVACAHVGSEKVRVIDSRTTTFALAILVREAVRLRDEGKSAREIENFLRLLISKIRLFAVVDTLKYLKMGGRISTTTAFVGGLLGINPIVSIVDGKVESVGKARGLKAGQKLIYDLMTECPPDTNYLIAFGNSNAPLALEDMLDYFKGRFPIMNYFVADIGLTVGAHVGPGAVGIAYIAKV